MIRLLLTECLSPHSSTHLDWLHTVFVKVIQQYSVAHKEKSENIIAQIESIASHIALP